MSTVYDELFGTPERAASTLADMNTACGRMECTVCPIADFCEAASCFNVEYDREVLYQLLMDDER